MPENKQKSGSLPPIKALFLDISGVLYEGDKAIKGAAEKVQEARSLNLTIRFVTNTTSKSTHAIIQDLNHAGIEVVEDELFSAPIAARNYLLSNQLRPYCLIPNALKDMFKNDPDPNCVLIGDAPDVLDYSHLNKAFEICHQKMPLIALGKNKYYRKKGKLHLDAGPFIHALEWASSVPAIIMGKPSKAFFQTVVDSTTCTALECLMVGDDVQGDVLGALDAGLQACLVRTGKYQSGDDDLCPTAEIINTLADLII